MLCIKTTQNATFECIKITQYEWFFTQNKNLTSRIEKKCIKNTQIALIFAEKR